ncbi:MAG: M28 family peptidase [Longimicrobiales bacterium]|nr:M28 family peptidase [Longimicrobiales bacterium]
MQIQLNPFVPSPGPPAAVTLVFLSLLLHPLVTVTLPGQGSGAGWGGELVGQVVSPPVAAGDAAAPAPPPEVDPQILEMVGRVSPDRLERDIRTLAGFGTRNTLSDTLSDERGIGAARRWIKAEFDRISEDCGGCLEVFYQRSLVEGDPDRRIQEDTWVVNVVAVLRGTRYPDRYVLMTGDIDSRASDATDAEVDAPGANDNATGMAGAMEAARVLSGYDFPTSVVLAGLSGEEQGLYGGAHMARVAREEGWEVVGVFNNDMIGNIEGIDGVVDNTIFRVFSQPEPVPADGEAALAASRFQRFYGGEVDGPSRQLARYVDRITDLYVRNLDAMMIYRLDRFGRGGHHRPFNDAGFPGVRIMEAHEHYHRQHQDVRTEGGIEYGDVIEGVDFDFAGKMTAVNVATLAALASAPPAPTDVRIGGAVRPHTTLAWEGSDDPELAGYKIYWRATTAPQWEHSVFVGGPGDGAVQVEGETVSYTLENIVIDNYLFGVAAVGRDGNESPVVFPSGLVR